MDLPFDLEPNSTSSVWITIHVPGDAKPGRYKGALAILAGNQEVARSTFYLRVVRAAVPNERSLKFTAWFWLGGDLTDRLYGFPMFSERWWALVSNAAQVMAEHRQNVILTDLMQLVVPELKDGALCYDFGNFDRWVELFKEAGVIGFIEGYHLLDRPKDFTSPVQLLTFQIIGGSVQQQWLPPEDPRAAQFLSSFLPVVYAHLRRKGWDKIYLQHILDEPNGFQQLSYYQGVAEMVRKYMPGVPTLDAVDSYGIPEALREELVIWVPLLGRFDGEMDLLSERVQSGHEVWFYTCLFPRGKYPNRFIDYPLLKVRLLPWVNFRSNFAGFLFAGGNLWPPDPMHDVEHLLDQPWLFPPGDTFIMYPDEVHVTVLSSVRYEALLEGIEDYEMLQALRAKNPMKAENIASAAISSFTDYVRDPAAFREIQRKLLEALSE